VFAFLNVTTFLPTFSIFCISFFFFLPFLSYDRKYLFLHTSLATIPFDEGLGMLPMSFKRLKAIRNEELFLLDLIHLCCIWAIEKYIKVNVIIFA
jgi:hypothetical protein